MNEISVPSRNCVYFLQSGGRNLVKSILGKGSSVDPLYSFYAVGHYFSELDEALRKKEISALGAHIPALLGLINIPAAALNSLKSFVGLANLGFDMSGKNDFTS